MELDLTDTPVSTATGGVFGRRTPLDVALSGNAWKDQPRDDLGRWEEGKSKEAIKRIPAGDCFRYATKKATEMVGDGVIPDDKIKVVHGVVDPVFRDRPYVHAWVEVEHGDGEVRVHDVQNSATGSMSKEKFEETYRPKKGTIKKYKPGQAVGMMFKHKHHGPWEVDDPNEVKLSSTDPLDFSEQLEAVDAHQQAADKLAASVIERAQKAGATISGEIRRETVALMRRLVKEQISEQELLREFMRDFRMILRKYESVLARTASDAQLAAWLQGGMNVVQGLPEGTAPYQDPLLSFMERARMGEKPPPVPPEWAIPRDYGEAAPVIRFPIIEAAAADLARRQLLTPGEYYAANYQSRISGFTVSRMASLDAMEKVRDALVEAVADGDSLSTFRKKTEEAFDASGLSPSRQELVFRQNVMTAYARGQKAVVETPLVQSVAVFAWRSEIRDSRLTPLCDALSRGGFQGTSIYLVDSELWRRVAPVSHFG